METVKMDTSENKEDEEEEEEEEKGSVPEAVSRMVLRLEGAKTDTERLAALFLVTKAVRADDLDAHSRRLVLDAVGFGFLGRLLRAEAFPNPPDDCPPALYKSVALSVLTCFCTDPELVVHPQMLANIPLLLGIVSDADSDEYKDDLTVVQEAYECLRWMAARWKGAHALVRAGAIPRLVDVYVSQSFKCDEAMTLIQAVTSRVGEHVWEGEFDSLRKLVRRLAIELEADNTEHKFEVCRALASVMISFPKYGAEDVIADGGASDANIWTRCVRRALFDILRSKVGKPQRESALRLASLMIDVVGMTWASEEPQFTLLLAQLACVEVRVGLENRYFPEIEPDAELVSSCFVILEHVLGALVTSSAPEFEPKQKEQLYCAMKGAYGGVLGFLKSASESGISLDDATQDDMRRRLFVCAAVRCLSAWLAEETSSARDDVHELLPFLLRLAYDTFQSVKWQRVAQQARKVRFQPQPEGDHSGQAGGSTGDVFADEDDESEDEDALRKSLRPPDLFRLLLPALCHLTAEDAPRKKLLDAGLEDMLLQYVSQQWLMYAERQRPPRARRRSKVLESTAFPAASDSPLGGGPSPREVQQCEEELASARQSLVTASNVLMNLAVVEPDRVARQPVYRQMLKLVYSAVPEMGQKPVTSASPGVSAVSGRDLVLFATAAVLGLLLLKQQAGEAGKSSGQMETDIPTTFVQSVVRFLWDAHEVDAESDGTLMVSREYRPHWADIMELWFLGMQSLGSLLSTVGWLADFLVDSGFCGAMVRLLGRTRPGAAHGGTLAAMEDFLCRLAASSPRAAEFMRDQGAIAVCQELALGELSKALLGTE